ncbi:hypothetical protein EW146_g1399 [Bondarzewia mesenterica]|uniref:Uncharacterized protein n=1 Tax=Bondarzewia mesenterica TaxID=1095465 RepID=A0A4S4M441_9AGAM|nr:hypothetical protein EW146_g1399 [Bondarzewia mesenterica]
MVFAIARKGPYAARVLVLLVALLAAAPVWAKSRRPPNPADPYADPANDPNNGLRYIASNTLTGIAFSFASGIGLRIGLHFHPDSQGIYIAEYLFVVLSAAGGGVSIGATTVQGAKTGSNIFLAGLAIQLVSFFFFTCTFTLFIYRVHKHEPKAWSLDQTKPWYNDWRSLGVAIAFSCVGILIRSVYRTIELSQGFEGPIATNEGNFYGLDTLPLFIAVVVYCPFWPGRFIPPFSKSATIAPEVVEENKSNSEISRESKDIV